MKKPKPVGKYRGMRQAIREIAEKVSKWPEWKRGGSAAAAKTTAGSKKSKAG